MSIDSTANCLSSAGNTSPGVVRLTFQQSIPIVEGKLYAWGMRVMDMPEPVLSRPPDAVNSGNKNQKSDSQQESWVVRHQYELWETKVIRRALYGMGKELQDLVRMRYVERQTWNKIAEQMNRGERCVFRLRDNVLLVMAYEFGLLCEEEYKKSVSR